MNKYTIECTDSDRAKACLSELITWYMKRKHPDVVDRMKQMITEHIQSEKSRECVNQTSCSDAS